MVSVPSKPSSSGHSQVSTAWPATTFTDIIATLFNMSETAASLPVDRTARSLYALLDLSKALGSEVDLDALLSVIVEKTSAVVDAERTSIFVYDPARDILWSHRGQGITAIIELPMGSGIVGDVARTLRAANVADAYTD